MEWIVEAEDLNDLSNGRFAVETKPLCRCKDCKHWRTESDHTCRKFSLVSPLTPNDYCSYGERKTDGEEVH